MARKQSYVERLAQYMGWTWTVTRSLRDIRILENRAEARIAYIIEIRDRDIARIRARILRLAPKIRGFFENERDHLKVSRSGTTVTADGGSLRFSAGVNSLDVQDEKAAIAELERRGIEDALRRHVELNKDYLRSRPDLVEKIPGISIAKKSKETLLFDGADEKLERKEGESAWRIVPPKEKK